MGPLSSFVPSQKYIIFTGENDVISNSEEDKQLDGRLQLHDKATVSCQKVGFLSRQQAYRLLDQGADEH